jgi:hypothetical protein
MDHDYALAFALANESLCLFLGAGFSRHVTSSGMPDWSTMLGNACGVLKERDSVLAQVTQARNDGFLLEDCAQIVELAFAREGKDVRAALADQLYWVPLEPAAAQTVADFLNANPSLRIITTNYDMYWFSVNWTNPVFV